MPPGIIWVSSRLSLPSIDKRREGVKVLTSERFCEWYEGEHIQEVIALPGVPRALRYESVNVDVHGGDGGRIVSEEKSWLTVYEMPGIDYRLTEEFGTLGVPREDTIHDIYEQCRFDTRFYRAIDTGSVHVKRPEGGSANFLLSWAADEISSTHIEGLSKIPGCVYVKRFNIVGAWALDQFRK